MMYYNNNENVCIFDIECTCDDTDPDFKKEIIQIGCVKITNYYEIVSTLNLYVKPVNNPVLTKYCTGLTGITQNFINSRGVSILEAIKTFAGYISDCRKIVTWGNHDKKFLYDAIICNNIKENP